MAVDLLERVQEQTPDFFEQVVLDVPEAIGYGGSREVPPTGSDGAVTVASMA